MIRLITPTSNPERIKIITSHASGFLYYVTITGITGQKSGDLEELKNSIKKIRNSSNLPIVAGFGINNRDQVNEICKITDGVVVGSSIVKIIQNTLNDKDLMIKKIKNFVQELKDGTTL